MVLEGTRRSRRTGGRNAGDLQVNVGRLEGGMINFDVVTENFDVIYINFQGFADYPFEVILDSHQILTGTEAVNKFLPVLLDRVI